MRLTTLALFAALLLTGCTDYKAALRSDLDTAAVQLQTEMQQPGILMAAAALYHAETGAFAQTPFELLSSEAAKRVGADRLVLAGLALDGGTVAYTFTPSRAEPNEESGTFAVTPEADGGYTIAFETDRDEDPDLRRRDLAFVQTGGVAVRTVDGTLALRPETVRALLAARARSTPSMCDASTQTRKRTCQECSVTLSASGTPRSR